ncbi:hypothetical protein [Streptomyces sp. NPDC102360]
MGNDDVPAPDDRFAIHDTVPDGQHIWLRLNGDLGPAARYGAATRAG